MTPYTLEDLNSDLREKFDSIDKSIEHLESEISYHNEIQRKILNNILQEVHDGTQAQQAGNLLSVFIIGILAWMAFV